MKKQTSRPICYFARMLFDRTILVAWPIRRPTSKQLKDNHLQIDADGICDDGWYSAGSEYSDINVENRFRFHDIMANRLNTRRAIREIVMPELQELKKEINAIQNRLIQVQNLLVKN